MIIIIMIMIVIFIQFSRYNSQAIPINQIVSGIKMIIKVMMMMTMGKGDNDVDDDFDEEWKGKELRGQGWINLPKLSC